MQIWAQEWIIYINPALSLERGTFMVWYGMVMVWQYGVVGMAYYAEIWYYGIRGIEN